MKRSVMLWIAGLAIGLATQLAWSTSRASLPPYAKAEAHARRALHSIDLAERRHLEAWGTSASLEGLIRAGHLSPEFAGEREGYTFKVVPRARYPKGVWYAVATPSRAAIDAAACETLFTNQTGLVLSRVGTFSIDPTTCSVDTRATPAFTVSRP